jgi:hypothetical protein
MRTTISLLVLVLSLSLGVSGAAFSQQNRDGGLGGWTKDESRRQNPLPGLEVVPATVVKLAVRTNGWWIVTLDNGQIWSQIENRPTATVAVGDDVTLRRSRIGAYILTTTKGIETRVQRDR